MPLYRDGAFSFLVSDMKWSLFWWKCNKTLKMLKGLFLVWITLPHQFTGRFGWQMHQMHLWFDMVL